VDRRCTSLRVLGGAQQNHFWLQLKADVTGVPVDLIDVDEATALGAAVLAGIGAGAFDSVQEAHHALALPVRSFEPDDNRRGVYSELYETAFRAMPDALSELTPMLTGARS
jgi:xylulokinase